VERIRRGDDLGGPSCEAVIAYEHKLLDADQERAPENDKRMSWCRVRSRQWKECVLAIALSADASLVAAAYGQCSRAEVGAE
jgi:hypothetical protein